MPLTHIDPDELHRNPAFSQGVRIEGPGDLLIVGGQNGVGPDGEVVSDDPGEQTRQALRNVLTVLAAAGATQADVAKMTIIVRDDVDIATGYAAAQEIWGSHPTAITVLRVAGLGRPDCKVEIECIAQVPGRSA